MALSRTRTLALKLRSEYGPRGRWEVLSTPISHNRAASEGESMLAQAPLQDTTHLPPPVSEWGFLTGHIINSLIWLVPTSDTSKAKTFQTSFVWVRRKNKSFQCTTWSRTPSGIPPPSHTRLSSRLQDSSNTSDSSWKWPSDLIFISLKFYFSPGSCLNALTDPAGCGYTPEGSIVSVRQQKNLLTILKLSYT